MKERLSSEYNKENVGIYSKKKKTTKQNKKGSFDGKLIKRNKVREDYS